jgi:hypothetical protein
MKIQRYSQFLSESKVDNSKKDGFLILENEYLKLKSEGKSEEYINENIFGSLFGSLGGGFTDVFKNYIVDWAAEKLGIRPYDDDNKPTFFYQVIRNIIENVEFTKLGSYFGKGSCKNWARSIVEALVETLEERGIDYLLPKLGLEINMNTGFGGTISAGFREALTNFVNDTNFMNKIEASIADKICGFNLGDIISGKNINPSDKQRMESELKKAEIKDPSIYTKAMKTGLSNIFQNM